MSLNKRRQGWQWTDGSPYEYDQWTLWAQKEPNVNEDVMRINNGMWAAKKDDTYLRYVCKQSTFTYIIYSYHVKNLVRCII